uniref:Chaperone protein DnaJ n=1 Tax=Noccaea caerulescens TaxID=107243 RepID=A0A1J3GLG3_NOCCA
MMKFVPTLSALLWFLVFLSMMKCSHSLNSGLSVMDLELCLQKWHPDKLKEGDSATSRFQEINEAYQVLSNPFTRQEYDKKSLSRIYEHNMELFNKYKELILTCNGLGMKNFLW